MIEIQSDDLWKFRPDLLLIPTNGVVSAGEAIMGSGVAKEAKTKFPGIQRDLARNIHMYGNVPGLLWIGLHTNIMSFPTKHHWKDRADPMLIARSAEKIVEWVERSAHDPTYILLPRPGCGYGGFDWDRIKPILDEYFDERFFVCSKNEVD